MTMKVALFVHCFFPTHFYGTETYTLQLAKRLRESGIDAHVVTAIFPGEKAQQSFVERYEVEGVPVISFDKNVLPNTRIKDTYYHDVMRAPLRELLAETRPDVIHVTHLVNHSAVLLEVAAELGIPCVATFTDFFGFCYNNKLEGADGNLCAGPSPSRRNCMACYLKAVAGQPALSKPMQWATRLGANRWGALALDKGRKLNRYRHGEVDGLVEDLRLRPDILAACYDHYHAAIAPTRFLETAYRRNGFTKPMVRSWFGVDFDRSPKAARPAGAKPVFGFIGQLAPHKGTDLLIEAFNRLPAGSAALHIYGPSDQDPVFMARLNALGPNSDVRFLGTFAKERTRAILDTLDVLVIPSRWYENSPLVLLNALASHTPVLVSDVEGMTEFVNHGVNGFAFERGNVVALEAALRRFVDDPTLATRLGEKTHFERDTRAMANDVISLYRRIRPGVLEARLPRDYALGCRMPLAQWIQLNRIDVFDDPSMLQHVSPFPPRDLMQNVSGLVSDRDFASHGADFFIALSEASPKQLSEYRSILDFGCGCGRLARYFKGHPFQVSGCDIDHRHVDWIAQSLDFMSARLSSVRPPIPYADDEFEAVISISIFTHLNEHSQDEFLAELARVTAPGGHVFLTVHGERALERARTEPAIRSMIDVPDKPFAAAQADFAAGRHAFILQHGHLTTIDPKGVARGGKEKLVDSGFEYGITFIPEGYVHGHWARWFDIVDHRKGALQDFQDLIVLRPKR